MDALAPDRPIPQHVMNIDGEAATSVGRFAHKRDLDYRKPADRARRGSADAVVLP